jgi:DNA modification methylase
MEYIKEVKDKYIIDELKHTIFRGDNRQILKSFPDKCIDLIYIDPPFFSGRKYTTTAHNGEVTAYSDMYIDSDTYIDSMHESLVELHRVLKNTGSIYLHCDWHASHKLRFLLDKVFDEDNFHNEIIWFYKTGGASKRYFSRKHDNIFFYSKTKDYVFNFMKEKSYLTHKYGFKNVEISKDEQGIYTNVGTRDVWDVSALRGNQPENLGFKTQKPIELIQSIIKASSNPGDIVLDSFMGSGTTLDAAYSCNRVPIGIDMGLIQINMALGRCKRAHIRKAKPLKVIGMSKADIEDYKTLVENVKKTEDWDDYRFQCVMCYLEGMEPRPKGPDGGIDGDSPDGSKCQVKQNKAKPVPPSDIKEFVESLRDVEAIKGIFIAYSYSKEAISYVKRTKRKGEIEIILKTPADYYDLAKVVVTTNDEIEQEIEEEKNQFKLENYM